MAAGSHDIGKVSPTFAAKIFAACGIDYKTIPALAGINPELEKQWGGHAGVSQATAEELGVPKFVAEILGQHHAFRRQSMISEGTPRCLVAPSGLMNAKSLWRH